MKKAKRIVALLLSIILFIPLSATSSFAYNQDEHDRILNDILFPLKEHDLKNNPASKSAIEALECACYLSIDQFNSNGKTELTTLANYGVKDLPSSVTQEGFYYTANATTHRKATHRGWREDNYAPADLKIWKNRKPILTNTVDKIFDFQGDDAKKDSFCAIVYYIHILGDRAYDCGTGHYYNPNTILELGGRNDKQDIISELKYYLGILFKNRKNNRNYSYLISKLDQINSDLKPLMSHPEKLQDSTSEEFKKYSECAKRTLDLMKGENFSLLLKGEPFFNEVFYNHPY